MLMNKESSATLKVADGQDLKVDRRASIVSKGSKNNRFRLKKKPPGVPLEGSLLGFKPLAPTASAGDVRS